MNNTQYLHQVFNLNSELLAYFYAIEHDPKRHDLKHLMILDATGELLKLNSKLSTDKLEYFLTQHIQVKLLTSDSMWIEQNAPRFNTLRGQSSLLEWHIIPENLKSKIQETAVIHPSIIIRKPVRDAYHGYISTNPLDIQSQTDYFLEIWQLSEPSLPFNPLGL